MKNKISRAIQDSLNFLDELCQKKLIVYPPIEFETYHPSDSELVESLKCWFGSARWSEDGSFFIQFGIDGSGSLFLLWYYPTLKTEPPVVFLGSEGKSCIFAANINDFIQQIASEKLFFPYGGDNICSWLEPYEEDQTEFDWQKLKNTVENKLGKRQLSPEEMRDRAINIHPNFSLWVESKID